MRTYNEEILVVYLANTVLTSDDFVAEFGLQDELACDPFEDPICNSALDALSNLSFGYFLGQGALAIGEAYSTAADPDLAQLSPSSTVIVDSLESGYAAEQTGVRYSIEVEDGDEYAGPFRLVEGAEAADLTMEDMILTGIELAFDGLGISLGDDSETDPDYLVHVAAGDALSEMGPILDGFPYLWNQWVANGTNDGPSPTRAR